MTAAAKPTVAIIGAGPAGLMAAEVLARAGVRVTIHDRMAAPARKFLLAGRGGLNLTHSEPLDTFATRYSGSAAAHIVSAVEKLPPAALIAWANDLGIETFIGSSGRVFPKGLKASPLLRAWLARLNTLGVTLHTRHTWTGFDGQGAPRLRDASGEIITLNVDATLLALGGASWPRLGSDGGWVPLLAAGGVTVTPLSPSNCGVAIAWSDIFKNRSAGQPLKRIALNCGRAASRGEAMVTRGGLEGGAIYALGPAIRAALALEGKATLHVDLKPDIDEADLAGRLARPRGSQSTTNFVRKASGLDGAALALLREAGLLPADPAALARRIKHLPLEITGLAGMARAISSAGGIAGSNLDHHLMLRAMPGVFAAGEMLDFDAPTGGYLLQACFASGAAAARGILCRLANADTAVRPN